jgi:NADPH-dependent curcumin reductase CurA
MEGFIVFDYEKEYPRALRDLSQWLAEGKIKRKETIVKGGLQQAENALRDLYEGRNTGKLDRLSTSTTVQLTRDRKNAC